MKKISIIILTLVLCGVCKAHVENYQSSNILSAQEAKYILEVFETITVDVLKVKHIYKELLLSKALG